MVEDNLTTPATGKAHIRVVHLSPDAATVNVFNGASTTPLFSNVSFKNATTFIPVDAAATGTAVTLNVKLATTGATVLSSPVTVSAGQIYTVVVRGFVTPPAGNTNTLSASAIMNN